MSLSHLQSPCVDEALGGGRKTGSYHLENIEYTKYH